MLPPLRRLAGVGNHQGDRDRSARGTGGELADPVGEALPHPLQDEAVGCDNAKAGAGMLDRERADPGIELLRRQLLAERLQASLPELGNSSHAIPCR